MLRGGMKRPTHRELNRRLIEALDAVRKGRVAFVEEEPIQADLLDLDFLIEDLMGSLPSILNEIEPRHYRGASPPARSYESSIRGVELFAFGWASRTLGCEMYLKFALKGGVLWISSFHKDRPAKGR
jgi:hypothetical protein